MEPNRPSLSPPPPPTTTKTTADKQDRDFLLHLEAYLAKRDGVDKFLKISRYAAKLLLSSRAIPDDLPLTRRLKAFESSVGLSRKAFRLGKFVQDVNALRTTEFRLGNRLFLSLLAYGGEGLYYFVEQFIWLSKSGLIDHRHARDLQKISAWAELIGYIGSISLKLMDLRKLDEIRICMESKFEDRESERIVKEKILMKKLSIIQDLADALMAVADVRDSKGRLSAPVVVSAAGLVSALISAHKNWVSC